MRVVLVDGGGSNIGSVRYALQRLGVDAELTADPERIRAADRVILPGVGAAAEGMRRLRRYGLVEVLRTLQRPLLGVCLGMQLLFDEGQEYGLHRGLGLIHGRVISLAPEAEGLKVPHMGWNSLDIRKPEDPLLAQVRQGDYVYFVHSYYAAFCDEALVATAAYGTDVAAVVRNGCVCGTQFHPEKSGAVGLSILAAFAKGAA